MGTPQQPRPVNTEKRPATATFEAARRDERQENGTADEAVTYDRRLHDLEAHAFRTGRTLAKHSEQLATIREQQHTAVGKIDATGAPGTRTTAERLDTIEQVLFALAQAQGIDQETAG